MSRADDIFVGQMNEILTTGSTDEGYYVRPEWEDGTKAHSRYITQSFVSHDSDLFGVPIQTQRKIAWKSALREILALYVHNATTRQEFEDLGITWWDSWFDENDSLGTSYAYQLKKEIDFPIGKMRQFDRVLSLLKSNPMDRRIITNMLNLEEMKDMALPPCAYSTMWSVRRLGDVKYLDMTLIQRSGDAPVAGFGGINTIQYYFLLAMVAHVSGYKIGNFTHYVNNLHIYEKHIPIIEKVIMEDTHKPPKLWINPEVKDFYDFTENDIKLLDYKYSSEVKGIEIAV